MRNIFVLPTYGPSRLISSGKEFNILNTPVVDKRCKNMYITSDEKIEEGDWYITILDNEIFKADSSTIRIMNDANKCSDTTYKNTHFKIILTTDQNLIKNGIQAIDDEFLEWFVKNNKICDFVKIKSRHIDEFGNYIDDSFHGKNDSYLYEIIIPSVEYNYNCKLEIEWLSNNPQCKQIESCSNSLSKKCVCLKKEPKQKDEKGRPMTYWGGLAEPKQDLEKEMFELEQELDIPSHLRWHNSKPKQETLEENIVINLFEEELVELFNPLNQSLGLITEIQLLDIQCQIAEKKLSGYYVMIGELKCDIDNQGELQDWDGKTFERRYKTLIKLREIQRNYETRNA